MVRFTRTETDISMYGLGESPNRAQTIIQTCARGGYPDCNKNDPIVGVDLICVH